MTWTTSTAITILLVGLSGCGPGDGSPDGSVDASCSLDVTLGTGDALGFTPLSDGDAAEVILGFQGFRMLQLAVRITETRASRADVSAYLAIDATGVEVDQRDDQLRLWPAADGSVVVERYLLFFNDAPASQIIGQDGRLDVIARAGGCTGGSSVTLELRDDDTCIAFDVDAAFPDGAILDAGALDGAMACESP